MALFTDNFNRADTASDLGANWTDCVGVGLGISSNAASHATATASRGDFVTGTTQTDNQYAQGTIQGVGAGHYFSILLRGAGADGTRNCYQISVGGTNELYISEVTNGTSADLTTGTFTLANGMVLRAEAEGTTLRLLLDGTQRLTTTDATLTTGKTGIEIYNDNGAAGVTFDNFEAGDIGGAGGSILKQMLMNH